MIKKFFILIIIFIGAVSISFLIFGNKQDQDVVENNVDHTTVQQQILEQDIVDLPDEPEVYPEWYESDKDHDGLTDDEEKLLGTDMWSSDSDGDSISDIDEVQKYKTDPMKSDTDGDSFWDGLEIMGGYNPNGGGKM